MTHPTGEPECPDPNGVEMRLAQLQAPWPALREALRRGHLAGDFCTRAHARTYRGLRVYHEVNGELRGDFANRGWYFEDEDNIPRIVRPDGAIVITAVSGNEFTGTYGAGVQTRRPRGEAGRRLVRTNAQIAMLDLLPANDPERLDGSGPTGHTWFLLYYRDGDVVRSELSLADGVTEDGHLLVWRERLIFPEFDLYEDGGASVLDPELTPDVDVPVIRRNA